VTRRKEHRCKGQNKDDVVPRTSKGRTLGRRHQPKPERKNSIRNRGLRQQLRSKREFNKTLRKTLGLDFVKETAGMSSRLRKVKNWILWRGRPPPKRKKILLAAVVPGQFADTINILKKAAAEPIQHCTKVKYALFYAV
jgi:hypothetical protein